MHELSIALSIVDMAAAEVAKHGGTEVEEIELEIGELSGLEMDSFNFAWPMAIKNSVLEHAERIVQRTEGKAICGDCGEHFSKHKLFDACPKCNSYLNETISGKELRIKTLLIKETENEAGRPQPLNNS